MKRSARVFDALTAYKKSRIQFRGCNIELYNPQFWNDAGPENFKTEIEPYFDHMDDLPAEDPVIIDAGAATGHFAVACAARYPRARIYAFEPSMRQRILLRRNARLNHVASCIQTEPVGLWDKPEILAFRTHGALSSLADVSQIPKNFVFDEQVKVIRLDDWVSRHPLLQLHLVKMDIEGAELEALEGMRSVLARYRPTLLIQAYHIRDGKRTLEQCARSLELIGYVCREAGNTGLLVAKPGQSRSND